MSLVNVKKKNIKFTGDYPNGFWQKWTYNDKGNIIEYCTSSGYKSKYNNNGDEIYWENGNGAWCKKNYDEKRNEIYYENESGYWKKKGVE